jgi:hypothetical protein
MRSLLLVESFDLCKSNQYILVMVIPGCFRFAKMCLKWKLTLPHAYTCCDHYLTIMCHVIVTRCPETSADRDVSKLSGYCKYNSSI